MQRIGVEMVHDQGRDCCWSCGYKYAAVPYDMDSRACWLYRIQVDSAAERRALFDPIRSLADSHNDERQRRRDGMPSHDHAADPPDCRAVMVKGDALTFPQTIKVLFCEPCDELLRKHGKMPPGFGGSPWDTID